MSDTEELARIIRGLKRSRTWLVCKRDEAVDAGDLYSCGMLDQESKFIDETIQILNRWQAVLQVHELGIQRIAAAEKILPRARAAQAHARERLKGLRRDLRRSLSEDDVAGERVWLLRLKNSLHF